MLKNTETNIPEFLKEIDGLISEGKSIIDISNLRMGSNDMSSFNFLSGSSPSGNKILQKYLDWKNRIKELKNLSIKKNNIDKELKNIDILCDADGIGNSIFMVFDKEKDKLLQNIMVNSGEKIKFLREIKEKLIEKKAEKKIKEQKQFEVKVKDRYIWINNYLLSKPHAVGTNFEFFYFIRRQPANSKITKQNMPNYLRKEIGSKRFAKLLNELGFKGEILKAYFPKRGKIMVAYRGDKITKKDLEKAGIKIPLFLKELELAHLKNSSE